MARLREIREMSPDDRQKLLVETQAELMHERGLASMGGAVKNPGKIRRLRTAIARIHTIVRETELGITRARKREEKKAPAKAPRRKKTKTEA